MQKCTTLVQYNIPPFINNSSSSEQQQQCMSMHRLTNFAVNQSGYIPNSTQERSSKRRTAISMLVLLLYHITTTTSYYIIILLYGANTYTYLFNSPSIFTISYLITKATIKYGCHRRS